MSIVLSKTVCAPISGVCKQRRDLPVCIFDQDRLPLLCSKMISKISSYYEQAYFCVSEIYLSPSMVVSSVGSKVVVLLYVFVAPIVCAGIYFSTGYVICFVFCLSSSQCGGLVCCLWCGISCHSICTVSGINTFIIVGMLKNSLFRSAWLCRHMLLFDFLVIKLFTDFKRDIILLVSEIIT